MKLSAAWLIERAGIRRGFALPGSRAAISTKHTLALTNRGGATADEIAELARFVQARVAAEFGVRAAAGARVRRLALSAICHGDVVRSRRGNVRPAAAAGRADRRSQD